jgi:uncharacterized protein (TIGR02597 family)
MTKPKATLLVLLFVFAFAFLGADRAVAAVTVTPASGGGSIPADTAANAPSPAWISLGAITITESAGDDFAAGTNVTLILKTPTGFEFNTEATPSLAFTANQSIADAAVAVTDASTLTVTLTVSNTTLLDMLTIGSTNAIQVRPTATTPLASGSITMSTGSTATITGIAEGSTSLGALAEVAGAAALVRVETAATGGGTVVAAQDVTAGSSVTGYAIARDAYDNFVANVAADSWSLAAKTAGVVDGDLVPAGDGKSATFTGHVVGMAAMHATSGELTADSGILTVVAGSATKMIVTLPGETFTAGVGNSGTPAAQTAGTAFTISKLTATDNYANIATSYTGEQTITYSGPGGSPTYTTSVSFTAGQSTTELATTLRKAETTAITATGSGGAAGVASSSLTVDPGAFAQLQVLMPGETAAAGTTTGKSGSVTAQTAGTAFDITVNAVDANWNLSSASDTVHLVSTDPNAMVAGDAALSGGIGTFSVTLNTSGSWTVTASDVTNSGITPNTGSTVTVNAGAFTQLQLLVPGETAAPGSPTGKTGTPNAVTTGTAFSVTVNAVDANWNLVNTITHTVAITTSDGNATPPPNHALSFGTYDFSVTLKTAGSATVTATDVTDGTRTPSTSPPITVYANPEPADWYPGDMHVHRSCGGSPVTVSSIYNMMVSQDLSVVALLADMGNGEVQDPVTDLPLVNGQDDGVSTNGHIVHWDAEWHFDPTYTQYAPELALGGHIVALGLTNAQKVFKEYTKPIFDWAHAQGAIAGFAHLQYLNDAFPTNLDCCTPLEYPVEVALGACDFISEDVAGSDSATRAYYRLLNCGFRPGFVGGSDHPCSAQVGSVITYVHAPGSLTYSNWIQGIKSGRTVVSRTGHNQFLELKVNGTNLPGDEIQLTGWGGSSVPVTVEWTAAENLTGRTIQLVQNGLVVASKSASVTAGATNSLSATVDFRRSGWLCARTMGANGHELHTAAVFVKVNGLEVRASVADAQYYVQWLDNLLTNTASGGVWGSYFVTNRAEAQARYQAAKAIYQTIALEAAGADPYGSGPGGPILVVRSETNAFSTYYAEILLNEGLNEFGLTNVSAIAPAVLANYDVVILGDTALTADQVTTLSDWVSGGGNLIAMRPDKQLAGLLGLTDAVSTLAEGYLLVNRASEPGLGIVGQTIQFHGTADRYTLNGASSLATLYSDASTATPNPAVTLRSVGANGGQAAAFTFDLARSIVLTRQGNPAWVNQNRDAGVTSDAVVRSDDLFYGAKAGDVQPDWVNLNKVAIPQADEQQRLLANMIISLNADRKLLPRFWYFPHGHEAVVVMTADNHGSGSTAERFDQQLAASPAGGSVDDWETIRSSAYLYGGEDLTKTGKSADAYNTDGFEIGLHIDTGCANYTPETLKAFLTDQLDQFSGWYPNLPSPTTLRVHCVPWSDYTTLPEVEFDYGIRLDVNYYYYPEGWIANRPGLFTGSGMPMRFATTSGRVIDVYQAATQMHDESGQSYPYTIDTLLDRALGPEGYYGAFVANMHTDPYAGNSSVWASNIVDSAIARGVPVVSSRQMLTWLDARNGSSISSILQTGDTETFSINARADARGLEAMVPVPSGKVVSEVLRGVTPITNSVRWVKGVLYATFPALTGNYQISYEADTNPPVVSAVSPTNGAVGVSVSTAVLLVFSEPMDPLSINTNSISVRGPGGALVPAIVAYNPSTFTVTALLTPDSHLNHSTTYTVVVTNGITGVKDLAGKELADVFTASFSTANPAGIWDDSAVPAVLAYDDPTPIEVGLKFQSAVGGYVTGIRFYKGPGNTGTHLGNLWWNSNHELLARVTFVNEAASGWQYQALTNPVAIASNTTYVVSYYAPVGRYSATPGALYSGVTNYPLRALSSSEGGGNGVFVQSAGSVFPTQTYNAANYWVDVVFTAGFGSDTNGPTVVGVSPVDGAAGVSVGTAVRVTFSEAMDPGTITNGIRLTDSAGVMVPSTVAHYAATNTVVLTPNSLLHAATTYTVVVTNGVTGVKDMAGNALTNVFTASFTTAIRAGFTIWDDSTVPAVPAQDDPAAVELGVKFKSVIDGYVTGIRFYKGAANTGTHVGNLWTSTGTLLGSVTFVNETNSGWQYQALTNPVPIIANTTYVVSYHAPAGRYSADADYFSASGVDRYPLRALANGEDGPNGVFVYSASSAFPTNTYNAANYWVDVVVKAPVTIISGVVADNKVYSGTATATLHTNDPVVLSGVLGIDSVSLLTNGYVASFASVGVSNTIPVIVNGLSLGGHDAGNYLLTQPTNLAADITPAGLTVAGVAAANKVYDATTAAMLRLGSASLAGVMPGDDVSLKSLVYDNSANDLLVRFDPGALEVGNEIILTEPVIRLSEFSFEWWGTNSGGGSFAGNVQVQLRFYMNDGPLVSGYPSPGTVLFDSGPFSIPASPRATLIYTEADFIDLALVSLVTPVPESFTWSVQFSGMGPGDTAGLDLYYPAVVGQNYGDYWERNAGAWLLKTNSAVTNISFASRLEAFNGAPVGTFSDPNVGPGKTVTVSGLALSGADATNYTLTQPTGLVADITPAAALVALGGLSQTYDGTARMVTATTTPEGLTVLLTYNGSPNAPTNASSYEVIGTVSDANYAGGATNTLVVTARPITVTADAKSKVYGDSDPELTWQISTGSLVPGDSLTGSLSRMAGEAVGSYAIVQDTLSAGANYDLTYVGANLTIIAPPQLLSMEEVSDSIVLVWSVVPGLEYQVQIKDNLPDAVWTDVGSPVTATTSSLSFTNSPGDITQRFYRIVQTTTGFGAGAEIVSDPAGFYKLTFLGNSDTIVSIPFARPAEAFGVVNSVSGNVVQVQGVPNWTSNQFVYAAGVQSNTYYLRFESGAKEGYYYPITGNDTNNLTLNLGSETLEGVSYNDRFLVVPYWTLGSVFENGSGIHPSTSTITHRTEVLIPNSAGSGINLSPGALYYYYTNTTAGAAAWRLFGSPSTNRNDDILPQNVYMIIRHKVATNTTFTSLGRVILTRIITPLTVNSTNKQDIPLALPRATPVSLDGSGLIASGAFVPSSSSISHQDELLAFDNSTTNFNKSPSDLYYYLNSAWRKFGTPSTIDVGASDVFLPGRGFVIRKAAGTNAPAWVNQPIF